LLFAEGDIFIANGQFLKNQLIEIGCPPDKIRIIPNGVDIGFFSPQVTITKKNPNTIKLITVGRLIDVKNQSLGIKTLRHLSDNNVNARYSIIGAGPLKDDLKKLAMELNVESKVDFFGRLDQKSILLELLNSDIFLMTSVPSKSGRQETQGIVTIEAQASGLPVIAVRNGGIENTLSHGETGFLADLGNQEEYVNYALELANNSVLRAELSANAPKFVHEKFDDKTAMNTLKSLYAEVLG
jgi:colanic acid/amylovoran biosynthesis glycosyltransferase